MKTPRVPVPVLLVCALFPCGGGEAQTVDAGVLRPLGVRGLGPHGAGGSVVDVEVGPDDRTRIFAGAATGGLWRSENAGTSWEPVFDRAGVQTVGAVEVSAADPGVVWVGTGTSNGGDGSRAGLGIFRSEDGGATWQRAGLAGTGRIRRIVAHPGNPDVAWAAVPGATASIQSERGVFRTRDGGRTWQTLLPPAEERGARDVALDPENPDRLLVATGRVRNDTNLGGPEPATGGIYLSEDGGETWERVGPGTDAPRDTRGLAARFAPSRPDVAYGMVEADGRISVIRSEDGGRRWNVVNEGPPGSAGEPSPDLRVDPRDEDRVYRLGRSLAVSRDGGVSFEELEGSLHPGIRDLWIDPSDPRHLMAGTEGGVFVSRDRGRNWRSVQSLPLAGIHAVSVDMEVPFRVYAAAGDDGTWLRASTVWAGDERRDRGWTRIGREDARSVLVDPRDSRFVYSSGRRGELTRFDRRTGEGRSVSAWAPRGAELRFGDSAPLAFDPYRPEMIYLGSQFAHRTSDRGETWQVISGDLSGGSAAAGSDATRRPDAISSLAASPVQEEVIWAGTADGRLHLTRSSGGTWTEVTSRLPAAPAGARISDVEASKHHGGTAFVAVDRSGSGDRGGYLYRTGDYGRSWERLGGDGALPGVVLTVEQDPLAADLLFAGTTRGLHVSLSGGSRWIPWTWGPPAVPIRSLVVHPRDYDLVMGTEGRGVHVLDDIRPLRALARRPELVERPLHLFEPPPAYLRHGAGSRASDRGAGSHLRGDRRPYGALLTYHVGDGGEGPTLTLEVVGEDGDVRRRMELPGSSGLHRVSWDLGVDLPEGVDEAGDRDGSGPPLVPVLPGRYTLRLGTEGSGAVEQTVRVVPDPRSELSPDRRRAKQEALLRAVELARIPGESRDRLARVESAVFRVLGPLGERQDAAADTLRRRARELRQSARDLGEEADRLSARHQRIVEALASSFDAPTESQRIGLQEVEEEIRALAGRVNDFLLGRVGLFNDRLRRAGLDTLPELDEVGR